MAPLLPCRQCFLTPVAVYCSPTLSLTAAPQTQSQQYPGSRFSKAHRVCPLSAGALPGSVLLQKALLLQWVPVRRAARVLCPVPPKGAAGALRVHSWGTSAHCAHRTCPSPRAEEGEVLVHSSVGNGLMFLSVMH